MAIAGPGNAFPWDEAPRYLIRDRDTSFGAAVSRRLRAMGIRDRPITPRSPWQNSHVERLIGSMGSRSNRYPKSSKAIAILDPDRYVEDDLTKEDELAILDETKQTLSQRVARLDTGM